MMPGAKGEKNVPSQIRANVIRDMSEVQLSETNLALDYLGYSFLKGIPYRAVHCLR